LGCGARKDTITVDERVHIKSHRRHLGFRTPRLFVHQAAVCAAFALALSIQHFDIESHESIKPAGSSYHCLKLAIASSRFTLRWQGAQVCAILILGIIFRYYQIILSVARTMDQ